MKLSHVLVLIATLIVTPLLRAGDLPAPLPEFMDDAQAAKWTAEQTAASANEPSTQFYTGKPYVADAGGYVFKYRTYNPEMSRWTSADPSGFPDGANNEFYAPLPTNGLDNDGLVSVTGLTAPGTVPSGNYTITYQPPAQLSIGLTSPISFTGFTFNTAPSASGSLATTFSSSSNGENMNAQLSGGSRSATYGWIQIISTNDPLSGTQLGTVISTSGGVTTSFDNAQNTSAPYYGGGQGTNAMGPYSSDTPGRSLSNATSGNPVVWNADMYLVSYSGTSITVLAGFSWGFTITE